MNDELGKRIEEVDLSSSFLILSAVEAVFRLDYEERCYQRGKDPISRRFREINKSKHRNVSLDEDIFDTWLEFYNDKRRLIGELRGAFRLRHWLAHGRYWNPKLGRRYNYEDVYTLAEELFRSLPFYGATARSLLT